MRLITLNMSKICIFWSILLLVSCTKEEIKPMDQNKPKTPPKNDSTEVYKEVLIEQFSYNSNGVVFKIVNDLDSAFDFQKNINIKIDSIALRKFHFPGSTDYFHGGWTWFTKKGQYVCWRDSYTHENVGYEGFKWLDMVFPSFPNYCLYGISVVLYSRCRKCNWVFI